MSNLPQLPPFDPVEIFLRGKTSNVLSIITNNLNNLNTLKDNNEKRSAELEISIESMQASSKEASETFQKLSKENEDKFLSAIKKKEDYIKSLKEQIAKFEQILATRPSDQALIEKISQAKDLLISSDESIKNLQHNLEKTTNDLNAKNEEFLNNLKLKNKEILDEIEATKSINANLSQHILYLDNLHKLSTKNPSSLFKDKVPHDLILFAHKDKNFRVELNEFICTILKSKDYKTITEKVGAIIEEVATKNRGLAVHDLVQVYSKLISNTKNDGFEVLNKPLTHVFVDPGVEKALRSHRDDIKLPEILQIARLNIDIHKKVLIHPVCLDFFISFVRAEVKEANNQNRKFEPPDVQWDSLIYLTKKWPFFFKKFGNSLANFEDLTFVRMFDNTLKKAELIIRNEISEKILDIIINLREAKKDTFSNDFGTRDYISLLHDTISMAATNAIRCPLHVEILKLQEELDPSVRTKFLMLFEPFDVKRMLMQENLVNKEDHQNIYLKFNSTYFQQSEMAKIFSVPSFEKVPIKLRMFLETLSVDPNDHYERMLVIVKKIAEFEANISQSVVSADRTLPVVNKLHECTIKCCEYIDVPHALEKLIISKEMEVTLNRRANSK